MRRLKSCFGRLARRLHEEVSGGYMLWCVCVCVCVFLPMGFVGFEDIGPYESIGCRGFGIRAFSVFDGVSLRAKRFSSRHCRVGRCWQWGLG